jgi:hypothetical protein
MWNRQGDDWMDALIHCSHLLYLLGLGGGGTLLIIFGVLCDVDNMVSS